MFAFMDLFVCQSQEDGMQEEKKTKFTSSTIDNENGFDWTRIRIRCINIGIS